MTFKREVPSNLPVGERVKTFDEFIRSFPEEKIQEQAYRCMNCGVPFCHYGCPLGNQIPDFNDAVKDGRWRDALDILHSTNNFPEFTGRICPALCEASCVLGINEPAVAIEYLEREIAERGWKEGWIKPEPPASRTGKSVAVVGAGPAGLAAAQQLNRAGHTVTVYERDDEPGGLLLYGIPNFKLDKSVVRRRVKQLIEEGVQFKCESFVGRNVPSSELDSFDAVVITTGSTEARRFDIPGADSDGIHLAMEFLPQQTRRVLNKDVASAEIKATGKNVVVIGGGDTGSDCIGTSIRQGAKNVYSLEIMPKPPLERDDTMLWPSWPFILRTSSSHEEGGTREWSVLVKEFLGQDGHVTGLRAVRVEWTTDDSGCRVMNECPDTEFTLDCDLVLLAMGFLHPEHDSVVNDLGLELDPRGNVLAKEGFKASAERVFAAGDARRGQSLVVWAIHEGREAARAVDMWLQGHSDLPSLASFGYDGLALNK